MKGNGQWSLMHCHLSLRACVKGKYSSILTYYENSTVSQHCVTQLPRYFTRWKANEVAGTRTME